MLIIPKQILSHHLQAVGLATAVAVVEAVTVDIFRAKVDIFKRRPDQRKVAGGPSLEVLSSLYWLSSIRKNPPLMLAIKWGETFQIRLM